ncbi:hypothetical protein HOU03_gp130 [Caulobacter phage CcrSC]|uniref:Uncharacterized protein n=1 Tax=Caulobacter phage CcrSC TaxID=2283272 RepID=A0A385EFS7_9CAUD|nr:hypothetical protein HOU03_gp130 [Caulobacter phage CcrSC]AXQ69712.1 hypothetical protein CcrSC_gp130 [Caulobacter phage CcrSC]
MAVAQLQSTAKLEVTTDANLSVFLANPPAGDNELRCNTFDMWLEVEEDINVRHAQPLVFGTAPEPEGQTAGVLDACDVETFCGPCGEGGSGNGGGGEFDGTGFDIILGPVAQQGDGSWDGAAPLNDSTPVSEAIDRLNEILGRLVPSAPPEFPNASLSVSNSSGASPRLATGVADNSGDAPYAPGASVTRITSTGVSSFTFGDVGPGNSGAVQVLVNGALAATRTLTGSDEGNYAGLVIADQKDYPPATPGFYKSIDVTASNVAAPVGVNKFQMKHTGAGQTNVVYFVRDAFTASPAVSDTSLALQSLGTLAYSSGVPHFGTGGQLLVGASTNNFSGETYYGGSDPFSVSGSGGIMSTQSFGYAALGLTTPFARNTTATAALTPQIVSINGSVHGSGQVSGTARNVNGSGSALLSTTTILVKNGSAGGRIDENAVTVSGLGSSPNGNPAVRVKLGAGDTPGGAYQAWVSADPLDTWEAAVVAGVLAHNQTDYTVGVLPQGPDYSIGRSGAQYVTFLFQRAPLSQFKIAVTGAYAGCWTKLPGVSDATPNAPNGWWNGFKAYDGAGVPGEAGDPDAGCATGAVMTGGSGTFTMTFGTQSSTNATGNTILVRFKLNPGQSITALSFTA